MDTIGTGAVRESEFPVRSYLQGSYDSWKCIYMYLTETRSQPDEQLSLELYILFEAWFAMYKIDTLVDRVGFKNSANHCRMLHHFPELSNFNINF